MNDIFFLVDASRFTAAPVYALRAVYILWFTAAPVYISWFTASRFTFYGLRFAVDISLLTPCGLFGLVI